MKIVITKGKTGWFWKMVANNGNTLAHSEMYSSRSKAKQTANSVANELSVIVKVI